MHNTEEQGTEAKPLLSVIPDRVLGYTEHGMKHRPGEFAGKSVLLARMV